jgi:hypothetical protein
MSEELTQAIEEIKVAIKHAQENQRLRELLRRCWVYIEGNSFPGFHDYRKNVAKRIALLKDLKEFK